MPVCMKRQFKIAGILFRDILEIGGYFALLLMVKINLVMFLKCNSNKKIKC